MVDAISIHHAGGSLPESTRDLRRNDRRASSLALRRHSPSDIDHSCCRRSGETGACVRTLARHRPSSSRYAKVESPHHNVGYRLTGNALPLTGSQLVSAVPERTELRNA